MISYCSASHARPSLEVISYGERGIINTVVAHMRRTKQAVPKLLHHVTWGSGAAPSWLDTIAHSQLVVEMGLGDFGDPDLLIVCTTDHGDRYLVFVEAKVTSILDSMMTTSPSTTGPWGMAQAGFNSSLNGQLTLRYRFAMALAAWRGPGAAICESPAIFEQYRSALNDSQAKSPGRRLTKDAVLRILAQLSVVGLPEEHCLYVALTWDTLAYAFVNRSGEIADEYRPLMLDATGGNRFGEMLPRMGWLGYPDLERALGLEQNSEYQTAVKTMVDSSEPSSSYYAEKKHGRWEALPLQIQRLSALLAEQIGTDRMEKLPGSFSLRDENGLTAVKIIPNRDTVFIGIREGHTLPGWPSAARTVKRVRHVSFTGLEVTKREEAADLIQFVRSRFLREVVPAERPEPSEEP
jgi:hypothetical protein